MKYKNYKIKNLQGNKIGSKYKKEFEDTFRSLTQLGYAVIFISHDKEKTIKPQNGAEYQQVTSSMQSSALAIIENMSDIIAYAHTVIDSDGNSRRVLTLRSLDNSVRCGCRFRYIKPEIEFSYNALVAALNEAIDKEAKESSSSLITEERAAAPIEKTYDYDALMAEFNTVVNTLMSKNEIYYRPRISKIIEKYLGKGKKISDTTIDQAEFISLILDEINEDLLPTVEDK